MLKDGDNLDLEKITRQELNDLKNDVNMARSTNRGHLEDRGMETSGTQSEG